MTSFGLFSLPRWAQGFAKQRVVFIDTITACYTCGNHIVFLNIDSKKRTVLQSPGKGIGAFTASGTSRVLAVSEQRLNPSIFVLSYPELKLKHELKGSTTLDYTSLALSDVGPYLCCYSSLPDHTITVWNWENAEIICTQPQAGKDVIYLVFNPMNWQQICALGSKTLTVWNIEKSDTHHILMKRELHLPAADGSLIEREGPPSHIVNGRLTYWGPQMPASAIAGLKGVRADGFLRRTPRLTPLAACWTPAAELYVGCQEGYLLLANPDAPSVRILYNPTGTPRPWK
uniref:Cilia- and flagella-associated protein 43 n=1 Tax=Gadus morhua TaxID=8049 RepID=A0A8C4ZR12_GADMO